MTARPRTSRRSAADKRVARALLDSVAELRAELGDLRFAPPVTHVYDPLDYARELVEAYVERYARSRCEVLFLGMNPGPFGMAQTGVPFGEVAVVREWLALEGRVAKPRDEHPKRLVEGLACRRSEVSGARLWGYFRERFGNPDAFFEERFVWNYCPLAFLEETGRNRTPDKLPAAEREPLFAACDRALRVVCEALEPRMVVGIGRFARDRAAAALKGTELTIAEVLHPSPASPAANRGWAAQAEDRLVALGVLEPR